MSVGTPTGAIAAAIEGLYLVFRPYGLRLRLDACPCCTTDADQARIHSRPLRALMGDDLEHYVSKAISTWGDEDDFRHFLPRLLELTVNNDSRPWHTDLMLNKLGYAGWYRWPEAEQAAVKSFLSVRWSVGLTEPVYDLLEHSGFDADEWLCGVTLTGLDTEPYVDVWVRMGAVSTFGHVVAFLESNPHLLTEGRLAYWADTTEQPAYADQMRSWLRSLLNDPDFEARLAAWYQQQVRVQRPGEWI
jgi:hypothetical protein